MQQEFWKNIGPKSDDGGTLRRFLPNAEGYGTAQMYYQKQIGTLTLSAAGSPAKTSVTQDAAKDSKANEADCFSKPFAWFDNSDPNTCFWRTWQRCLTRGLDRVLGELGQIGYDAEWHCIPSAAVGAPHIRDRVFVIARIADSQIERCGTGRAGRIVSTGAGQENAAEMANAVEQGLEGFAGHEQNGNQSRRNDKRTQRPVGPPCLQRRPDASQWWSVEPDVGRVANGVPSRVDRLRGLGNAVVPQVAEWIGRQIIQFETERPGAGR
jgi:site-specific DNA-cytosine methylase